ncbi:MAG: DUF1178 family protein [Desulfobacterales bacterium]|jgi:hypothetical protein|nr:DUF1178 family protein [Desulfobacterales bacterium]MCU0584798.1 DUF1178 family protein [Desulfobacterales bacterium]
MIAYDLRCANGHSFEGWFEDRPTFLDQKKRGLISCPVCNDTAIVQVPSRFAIRASQSPAPQATEAPAEAVWNRIGKQLGEFVEQNFDNVGCDFAREALKIHYGVSAPRNIRGVSTESEEKILKQEGVEFFKIPMPPPDSDP